MVKPKTLIAIPAYNCSEYISRTLDSCLLQSIKCDIVIFDNCSNDKTVVTIKKYLTKYKNIKLIVNKKNVGREENVNNCLKYFKKTKHKYIKFVFSGDEIFPDCIKRSEEIFNKDSKIGAVVFPYEFNKLNNDKVVIDHNYYHKSKIFSKEETQDLNFELGGVLGAIIANVYSKEAIKEIKWERYFTSKLSFDLKILTGYKVAFIKNVLARFNLDSRRTHQNAEQPSTYFEYSYIESKFLLNFLKKKLTEKKFSYYGQIIIRRAFNHQLKFISLFNKILIVIDLLIDIFVIHLLRKLYFNNLFKVLLKNIKVKILYIKNFYTYLSNKKNFDYQPNFVFKNYQSGVRIEASIKRWNKIKKVLSKYNNIKTLKDIGCCTGFFTLNSSIDLKLQAIGYDNNQEFISMAKFLAKEKNINVKKIEFFNLNVNLKNTAYVANTDVTLLLSIWHHWVYSYGLNVATQILKKIWEKTETLMFFESGEEEVSDEFKLPFKKNILAKVWLKDYLTSVLINCKVLEIGKFSSGNYNHYKIKNHKRTLFLVQRI